MKRKSALQKKYGIDLAAWPTRKYIRISKAFLTSTLTLLLWFNTQKASSNDTLYCYCKLWHKPNMFTQRQPQSLFHPILNLWDYIYFEIYNVACPPPRVFWNCAPGLATLTLVLHLQRRGSYVEASILKATASVNVSTSTCIPIVEAGISWSDILSSC